MRRSTNAEYQIRIVGTCRVNAPFSQALKEIYSCSFIQLLESIHSMRAANGITPGYLLPLLKISIHLLAQFKVSQAEKELLFLPF